MLVSDNSVYGFRMKENIGDMERELRKLFRIAIIDDNKSDREMVKKVVECTVKQIEDSIGEEILLETFISSNDLLADLECGKYYSLFLIDTINE